LTRIIVARVAARYRGPALSSTTAMASDLQHHARRVLASMDLTALGDSDDADSIAALAASAATPHGAPAALCIWPRWIALARSELDRRGLIGTRIATVANFPDGHADPVRAAQETAAAMAAGADEIDVVFPWRALLAGDRDAGAKLVRACRDAAGERCLKIILETGELGDQTLIRAASRIAIDAGADFIKTSTGKTAISATLAAAETMLVAIAVSGGRCGFKAAGGIRRVDEAVSYLDLADRLLGPGWATPARFRIGASALLHDVLAVLGAPAPTAAPDGY
jgi:deoxyribose-phosphate aldolase